MSRINTASAAEARTRHAHATHAAHGIAKPKPVATTTPKPAPAPDKRATLATKEDRARVEASAGRVPPLLTKFDAEHGLLARVDAVRSGRPGMLPEERAPMRRALAALSKGELRMLRELLVEKPPHPSLEKMRGHPAIKGPPTAAGVLAILTGEALGVAPTRIAKQRASTLAGEDKKDLFAQVFRPGAPVAVRRSSGMLDAAGWSIRGKTPNGEVIVQNPAIGGFKLVDPGELLVANQQLLPRGADVSVLRSSGSIERGWVIQDPNAGPGIVRVGTAGAHKHVAIGDLIGWNPALEKAPVPPGAAARIFPRGKAVRVTRSGGNKDEGWSIGAVFPNGDVLVGKGKLTKTLAGADVLRDNPELLPAGLDVSVPRALGWVEDGWKVVTAGEQGVFVVTDGQHKTIKLDELLAANPNLLAYEAPPSTAAVPRVKLEGNVRAQSVEYLGSHRVPEGVRLLDGFADAGRGMSVHQDGTVYGPREVLVVDRGRDKKLQGHLAYARSLRHLAEDQRAYLIAQYVDGVMRPSNGNAEACANFLEKTFPGQEILIGDVPEKGGGGACRHRALLFKLMGDEANLLVSLVRGMAVFGERSGGHAWNEVQLHGGPRLMADVMNPTRDRQGQLVLPRLDAAEVMFSYRDMAMRHMYGASS